MRVAIEDALHDAIRLATGLSEEVITWAMQGGARPDGPFISLSLDGPIMVSQLSVRDETDLGQANGSEIGLYSGGLLEGRLTVACYDALPVERGTSNSQLSALALLSKVQSGLRLPSVRTALRTAKIAVFQAGPITNVGELLGPEFESRAELDLRFYYTDEVVERVGYIDSVTLTNQDTDESVTVEE